MPPIARLVVAAELPPGTARIAASPAWTAAASGVSNWTSMVVPCAAPAAALVSIVGRFSRVGVGVGTGVLRIHRAAAPPPSPAASGQKAG
jgi:hypothetical protein